MGPGKCYAYIEPVHRLEIKALVAYLLCEHV